MKLTAVVTVFSEVGKMPQDFEIPLDISANDLIIAFSEIFGLPIKKEQLFNYCIRTDCPKALLMGESILKDYGIRDGSKMWLWS